MDRFSHIFFAAFYILPFIVVFRVDYAIEWLAVAAIISAYAIGAFVGMSLVGRRLYVDRSAFFLVGYRRLVFVAFVYVCVRYPLIVDVVSHVISGDYAVWAQSNAVERYSGYAHVSLMDKIGTVFFVAYGFLLGAAPRKLMLWGLYLYVPMIFIESSGLARAGVLLSLSAFLVEYIIRNNLKFAQITVIGYVPRLALVLIGLMVVFTFSAVMRIYDEDDVAGILSSKVASYTIAIYEALFIWMAGERDFWGGYGVNTFASIYKFFGYKASQGFYEPVLTSYGYTNVFTNIRGLISDFGLFGAALFYILIGYSVVSFSRARLGSLGYLFMRFIMYIFMFPLLSPFIFTSVLAGFVLSYLLIVVPGSRFSAK